jgi:DNA-binding NtrC family response regulator
MESSASKKIIIVEQDPSYRDRLRYMVSRAGDLAFCFQHETTCLDNLSQLDAELIVMGSFPQDRSIRFMNALRAIDCHVPVIMISEDPALRQYLSVNRLGNMKVVGSAWNRKILEAAVQSNLTKRHKDNQGIQAPFIVGKNSEVVKMKNLLPKLGRSAENILIQGEKGVGKELLARAIHSHSGNHGMFIKIDASLLAGSTWRLFDVLKQNLRDSKREKPKTRQSKAGTLFVHEIGDLPPHLQAELVLIADEKGPPLVSNDIGRLNVFRLIASSSKSLEKEVTTQHFKKGLFYRLNTLQVSVPPLRRRKEDIPLLTDFFTYKYCKDFDKSYFELSTAIKDKFQTYRWPINIQELESVVKRAVMMNNEKEFLAGFMTGKSQKDFQNNHGWFADISFLDDMIDARDYLKRVQQKPLKDICWDFMAKVEKNIINKALTHTNWNRKKAALLLNISYKSMLNKIKAYKVA